MFAVSGERDWKMVCRSILLFLFISSSSADYKDNREEGTASFRQVCIDDRCDQIDLKIVGTNGTGDHHLMLAKRVVLQLVGEQCSHFTNRNPQLFSAIRICSRTNQSDQVEGTFFDADSFRYDSIYNEVNETHRFGRQRFDRKQLEQPSESNLPNQVNLTTDEPPQKRGLVLAQSTDRPIYGTFKSPVWEMALFIDHNVFRWFKASEEAALKYVLMNVLVADAMHRQMGIQIKVIALRFIHKLNFSLIGPGGTYRYRDEMRQYIVDNLIEDGVSDSRDHSGMLGRPDVAAVFTFSFAKDGILGLAYRPKGPEMGIVIVKPYLKSTLTETEIKPRNLHFYPNGVTLAHELGHVLDLDHADNDTNCRTRYGSCIMIAHSGWPLSHWLDHELSHVQNRLTGQLNFLLQKNMMDEDGSSTLLWLRIVCIISFVFALLAVTSYLIWLYKSNWDTGIHYHAL